jgi:Domain of unknown function (DUF5666)
MKSIREISNPVFPAQLSGEMHTGSPLSLQCIGHVQGSGNQTELPRYQRTAHSTLLLQRHSIEFLRKLNLGGPMKRVYLFTLLSVVFALTLTGCGGSNNTSSVAQGGQVQIQTGDAVNDQIVKFELTISSITLTGVSPTATTANLVAKPSEVEFVHQAGTLEPFTLANVPPGTYNGATFTVSDPDVVVINAAGVPTKIPATLTSTTVNVTFANLTIGTSPMFLNFDLDLVNSVVLNGTPITSATVTPKFTVSSSTVAPNKENEDDNDGENGDIHGSVTSISAPNFTISTNSATITFATDANTKFNDGLTSLAGLSVGDIVEVDAVTNADGSKLATKVERECDNKGEELEGIISATTGTPVTQITVAHQVDSTNSTTPPTTAAITLSANTQFIVRTDSLNLSSTPAFDASNIGKGQRVEADADGTTSPILASKLKLREQALFGTVAAGPTAGGFTLTLSPTSAFATLTGVTSVPVTIVNGTNLQVTPTAAATVRVRGIVFFNAGVYTVFATRVDNNN